LEGQLKKKHIPALILMAVVATIVPFAVAKPQPKSDPKISGKRLIEKNGCIHCHRVGGDGGTVGPPLDGISKHRDKNYILSRLRRPTLQAHTGSPYPLPEHLMQHVRVSPSDAQKMAAYLLTLPERELKVSRHRDGIADNEPAGSHFIPLKPNDSTNRGAQLYRQHGCAACHSIGEIGGHLAPNLAGVGVRRSRNFIENRIANGAIILSDGVAKEGYAMPPQSLSQKEVDDLTNFLLTLPADVESASRGENWVNESRDPK
jgi:mono/diheme cytochrome c family protein